MPKPNFKFVLFLFCLISIGLLEIGFSLPQEINPLLKGKVDYEFSKYSSQKVKVVIIEDGKPYKTLYANSKGQFETNIRFNHEYMVNMSMDYHATSKASINTKIPAEKLKNSDGAEFEFAVPLFQLFAGLNTGILNQPLLKMKYYPDKDRFDFDKDYSEKISIDLENFMNKSEQLARDKVPVEKEEKVYTSSATTSTASSEKKRKVIKFDDDNKPKAENKRGHRNIMETDPVEEEVEEVIAIVEENEAVEAPKNGPSTAQSDPLFLKEEIDVSDYTSLNVIPRRIVIKQEDLPEELNEENVAMTKAKMLDVFELARLTEEANIKVEIRSYNQQVLRLRESRQNNKKTQNTRLKEMIKTIALAEIYAKKDYYKANPINHNEALPSIITQTSSSWFVDEKIILVRYPNESKKYIVTKYFFGMTQYRLEEKLINEDTFCKSIGEFSKNNYACTN